MSAYISLAPIIERTAAANASALPAAPQLDEPITFRRTRSLAAGALRATARLQLRAAARLEHPARHRLAAA